MFYNPFKMHLVQFGDGSYGLRQLDPELGWVALDADAAFRTMRNRKEVRYRTQKFANPGVVRDTLDKWYATRHRTEEREQADRVARVLPWAK